MRLKSDEHPLPLLQEVENRRRLCRTTRRYASGEIDWTGRISKCGDKMLRSYLYEAAIPDPKYLLQKRLKGGRRFFQAHALSGGAAAGRFSNSLAYHSQVDFFNDINGLQGKLLFDTC